MKKNTYTLIALATILTTIALGYAVLPHKKERKIYVLASPETLVKGNPFRM